jgi:uncharacterized RDD family membrane protein YckC
METNIKLARIIAGLIDALIFSLLAGTALFFIPGLGYALGVVYMLLRDSLPFMQGQSVGKKIMGVRVVRQDSGAALLNDHATSATRNILLVIPIPIVGIIDSIFILINEDGNRLSDRFTKTTVVKA